MRLDGILRSWNEERGFGFIAPTRGGAELFVHVSALPRDGSRPVAGEAVSFELGRGPDGRPQAVKVVRTALGPMPEAPRRAKAPVRGPRAVGWGGRVLLLCAAVAVGYWGLGRYQAAAQRRSLELMTPLAEPEQAPGTAFRCDGRAYCSQMTSCAEATWFINHCPDTKMDGNHDGVPCEQQWCTGPGAR